MNATTGIGHGANLLYSVYNVGCGAVRGLVGAVGQALDQGDRLEGTGEAAWVNAQDKLERARQAMNRSKVELTEERKAADWAWAGAALAIGCLFSGAVLMSSGSLLAVAPAVPLVIGAFFFLPYLAVAIFGALTRYSAARDRYKDDQKKCRVWEERVADLQAQRQQAEQQRLHARGAAGGLPPPRAGARPRAA